MVSKVQPSEKLKHMFRKAHDTIVLSCLQGVMGDVYADDAVCPSSAMAKLGDFAFFAGKPNVELILLSQREHRYMILIPQDGAWETAIEEHLGTRARKIERYAFFKDPGAFDLRKLEKTAATLPDGCELALIDRVLYETCLVTDWARDLVSNYPDFETYGRIGIGVAALKNGELVAGASSYSSYMGGIEIEIDTKEECRRRGLALACGARLILECLDRGLYPSWDAANLASVRLAKKLGYRFDRAYTAYETYGGRSAEP